MTATYDLISRTTVGSDVSSLTISSIPGSYRDLVIVGNAIQFDYRIRFNASESGYAYQSMRGFGSTNTAAAWFENQSLGIVAIESPTSGNLALTITEVFDYAQTNKHKNYLSRSNTLTGVDAIAGSWRNTSAITSIVIIGNGTIKAGTTFDVFGIVA